MRCILLCQIVLGILSNVLLTTCADGKDDILIQVPGVRPEYNDQYLCTSKKLTDPEIYINKYEPKADPKTAHHMLIYTCEEPGTEQHVWNCGEMSDSDEALKNSKFVTGPVCKGKQNMIYAWAMGAPAFQMPTGITFPAGSDSGNKYLVLQVHYKDVDKFTKDAKLKDYSSVDVGYQTNPTEKVAGMYLLATDGIIPPHSTVNLEAACEFPSNQVVHPFAFRVHAHKHGVENSGYIVRNGKWIEIGRKSPQLPHRFYNISRPMTIRPGDIVANRCVMKNAEDRLVKVGPTQKDEMCNFYILYWFYKEQGKPVAQDVCYSQGWPRFTWKKFFSQLYFPTNEEGGEMQYFI